MMEKNTLTSVNEVVEEMRCLKIFQKHYSIHKLDK